jgi:6-phosphogluconolactonase (cycloisomerase 2 family)
MVWASLSCVSGVMALVPRVASAQAVVGPARCAPNQDRCVDTPLLRAAAVSPDGRHLYALNWGPIRSDDSTVYALIGWQRSPGGEVVFASPVACLTHPVFGAHPTDCGRVRGWPGLSEDDAPYTPPPRSIAISPDGRHVYVSAGSSIAVFARDVDTGSLQQLPEASGCLVRVVVPGTGCTRVRGIRGARRIALSADGRSVYVAFQGRRTSGVAVFMRDPQSGALTQAPGQSGCLSDGLVSCARARQLNSVSDVAVAPDGRTVYVTTGRFGEERARGGIAAFARDARDGRLVQLPGRRGCVNSTGARNCLADRTLGALAAVAVRPHGRALYTIAFSDEHAPRRHPVAGDGSVRRSIAPGRFPNNDSADLVALSPAGDVVVAGHSFGLYIFASGRERRPLRLRACWAPGPLSICSRSPRVFGYPGAQAIALAPDGIIYVSGEGGIVTVHPSAR